MFICQFPLCSLSNSIDKILNHPPIPASKMYQSEKPSKRADKFMKEKHQYPSFSASLLEKIYRSIDESEAIVDDLKFMKQSKSSSKVTADPPQMWHISPEQGKSSKNHVNNNSWDFNSVRFSSSDESISTPPPLPRPKPVRTSVSKTEEEQRTVSYEQKSKTEEKQSSLSYEQRSRTEEMQSTPSYEQRRPFDDYSPNPSPEEERIEKPKSMALKIYANLKQPISPGGRLVSFINSLFTPTSAKKTKNISSTESLYDISNNEVNPKSEKSSTCPSPCSFSPSSCLSKTNLEKQQKIHNGRNRSVRFHTTRTAAGVEQKPFPIKAVYGQGSSVSDAIRPPISKIVSGGRSYPHTFDVRKRHVKSRRRIEAAVGEFFKDYDDDDDDGEDDDDASTCSSSDLFELDGLTVLASDSRYSKELPVYETTRFELGRNLGYLANGLIF